MDSFKKTYSLADIAKGSYRDRFGKETPLYPSTQKNKYTKNEPIAETKNTDYIKEEPQAEVSNASVVRKVGHK